MEQRFLLSAKTISGAIEKGTAYWYNGSSIIGHRLYKEVNTFNCKSNVKGFKVLPTFNSRWETLATNLEEFNRVVDEFSSRQSKLEVAVGKSVETEAIPALNKLHQKKERALKQKEREQRLLNGLRTSGITRSCRNLRPITYTFDAYDRAIDEAIRQTKYHPLAEEVIANCHGTTVIRFIYEDTKDKEKRELELVMAADACCCSKRLELDDRKDSNNVFGYQTICSKASRRDRGCRYAYRISRVLKAIRIPLCVQSQHEVAEL